LLYFAQTFAGVNDVRTLFLDFGKSHNVKKLHLLRDACLTTTPGLDFDDDEEVANTHGGPSESNLLMLRALIIVYENCTDGASKESLEIALGEGVLVNHPSQLIKAIHIERKGGKLRKALAEGHDFNDNFRPEAEKRVLAANP
jgi:hypothetical protein